MAGVGEWHRGMPMRPQSLVSFARGNNAFALALFGRLRQRPGNLFFSPFSIRTALGLAHAGASGETAVEMSTTLCLASHDETETIAGILERLTAGGGTDEASVANSLWSQQGAPILAEFLHAIRPYRSELRQIDFRDGEGVRTRINEWVSVETKQRIPNVIPPDGLDAGTRLAIVNAVYFKGMWQAQFQPQWTREATFYLADGGTVRAPLMYQRQRVRYLKGADFQMVELLYLGARVSMVVFLPDRRGELSRLEHILSPDLIRECLAGLQLREVDLSIPRFRLECGAPNVAGELAALGMRLPFSNVQADFSGINGCGPGDPGALFISAIFHRAFVEVNEEGTEAAAATAVGLTLGADALDRLTVPIFRADHPFMFAIRERTGGAILFLGRVADPTSAGR